MADCSHLGKERTNSRWWVLCLNTGVDSFQHLIIGSDFQCVMMVRELKDTNQDLKARSMDSSAPLSTKKALPHLMYFPRTLQTFLGYFTKATLPHHSNFYIMWGLFDLNLRVRVSFSINCVNPMLIVVALDCFYWEIESNRWLDAKTSKRSGTFQSMFWKLLWS